ncbi:MAG: MarR family transcriptional regulator [Hyphomicrobiales bacterium]|nr:MarR family transcriptional regulator [Hyphomicrobiales bacterium]
MEAFSEEAPNHEGAAAQRTPAHDAPPRPLYDLIEALFFAYRDFVGDADRLLIGYGFGRAHHRVLHFVHRQPGLSITELLEILKITKQSLNRVLKNLVEQGFIEVRAGALDRRQRHLYATASGHDFATRLAEIQTARFERALAELGPQGESEAKRFLDAMRDRM